MTPEEAQLTIIANGFELTSETKKVVEYRSRRLKVAGQNRLTGT